MHEILINNKFILSNYFFNLIKKYNITEHNIIIINNLYSNNIKMIFLIKSQHVITMRQYKAETDYNLIIYVTDNVKISHVLWVILLKLQNIILLI